MVRSSCSCSRVASEIIHTDIAPEEEKARVVGYGVPVGVDEDRGRGWLGEEFPHNGFQGRSKDELDALSENVGEGDGPYPLRDISQKLPAIRNPPKLELTCFGAWAFRQRVHLLRIRHDAGGRDGVTKEILIRGADGRF